MTLPARLFAARLFACGAAAMLMWICAWTLAANAQVQNCRFIKAKVEREACYTKQEKALAAKRAAKDAPKMTDELQRLKLENDRINDRLRGICRGC